MENGTNYESMTQVVFNYSLNCTLYIDTSKKDCGLPPIYEFLAIKCVFLISYMDPKQCNMVSLSLTSTHPKSEPKAS